MCKEVMGSVVTLPENKKLFNFMAGLFEYVCKYVVDESICKGVTEEFGVVLIESLLNKVFNPINFCNLHDYCTDYTEQRLSIKDFAKRVLKDKPVPHIKEPTNWSNYSILHLTDTHIDLQYQQGYNTDCSQPFCCRKENGPPLDNSTSSGRWGSLAKCDIPIHTLE